MYACMYMNVSMCACMYVSICMCVQVCVGVCIGMSVHALYECVCMHVYEREHVTCM